MFTCAVGDPRTGRRCQQTASLRKWRQYNIFAPFFQKCCTVANVMSAKCSGRLFPETSSLFSPVEPLRVLPSLPCLAYPADPAYPTLPSLPPLPCYSTLPTLPCLLCLPYPADPAKPAYPACLPAPPACLMVVGIPIYIYMATPDRPPPAAVMLVVIIRVREQQQ